MRKFIIILFALICSQTIYSQKLTFSSELAAYSENPAVPKIAAIWEQYISSFRSGNPDSVRTDLWLNGSDDMIKYVGYNTIFYKQSEQHTFNIRNITDSIYEINTIAYFKAPDAIVDQIYKVCAVRSGGEFKLLNYFDVKKQTLNRYDIESIKYYYPATIVFKISEAKEAAKFVTGFKKQFKINDNSDITYIVANNLDECSSIMGITYTMFRSEKLYAGRAIYPRILLSARANHIHELVHAIMIPLYPEAPSILHEGIATYYGGGVNSSYALHVSNVKEYLSTINIDFSDQSNINKILDSGTYLSNTIGAMLIEYVLDNYGTEKVLGLFKSEDYEEIFSKLGVTKEGINDFVLTRLIKQTK